MIELIECCQTHLDFWRNSLGNCQKQCTAQSGRRRVRGDMWISSKVACAVLNKDRWPVRYPEGRWFVLYPTHMKSEQTKCGKMTVLRREHELPCGERRVHFNRYGDISPGQSCFLRQRHRNHSQSSTTSPIRVEFYRSGQQK
jgi:hypothetical protein